MTIDQGLPDSGIASLVAALPEKYQPIYGMPELSDSSSRSCEDRLEVILGILSSLREELGRPLRILDLGCAQGFFSLHLAALGNHVRGIDFLEKNIAVCNELARLHAFSNAKFEFANVEDVVGSLRPEQYDVVLGLSVFHHLVYQHGIDAVAGIVGSLGDKIAIGIFELALREEPLYWSNAQPDNPSEILRGYAFSRVLSMQGTHLSAIKRPLYYASNTYWHVDGCFAAFDSWKERSHQFAMHSHQGTRRYYFSRDKMLKKFSLGNPELRKVNQLEYSNEVEFLRAPPPGFTAPKLILNASDASEAWLLRTLLPGKVLADMIVERQPYRYESIVDSVIEQLVCLESLGLYHNDVRCWNILVDSNCSASLIDYGAISSEKVDCAWPHDLMLSLMLTIREIVQGHVVAPSPIRRPQLDVTLLPARYRNAFLSLFSLDRCSWSFAKLLEFIRSEIGSAMPMPAWSVIVASQEHAFEAYEKAIEASRHREHEITLRLNESLENAHHWYLEAQHSKAEDVTKQQLQDALAEVQRLQQEQAEAQRLLEEQAMAQRLQEEQTAVQLLQEQQAVAQKLQEEQAESQRLRVELEEARGLREELVSLRQTRHYHVSELSLVKERVRQLMQELEVLRQANEMLGAELNADASAELQAVKDELNASLSNAHHWYLRATSSEQLIAQLYSSRSWRLTRPLRGAARFVRWPKSSLRAAAVLIMSYAFKHPALARLAGRFSKLVPPLHARLVALAVRHDVRGPRPEPVEVVTSSSAFGQVGLFEEGQGMEPVQFLSVRGRALYFSMREKLGHGRTEQE